MRLLQPTYDSMTPCTVHMQMQMQVYSLEPTSLVEERRCIEAEAEVEVEVCALNDASLYMPLASIALVHEYLRLMAYGAT